MQFRKYLIYFRYFDWILFFSVLLLSSFSLAALYGIVQGNEAEDFSNFERQLIFVLAGIGIVLVLSFLDYSIFFAYSSILYIAVGVILLVVLVFGVTFHGTTGWLEFFGFTLQPVELAKLSLMVVLAKMFSSTSGTERDWKFILKTGTLTFIYFFLVLRQPDFGSAVLLFLVWFGLLIFSGVKKRYILTLLGIIAVSFLFSWMFLFEDFQKDRIKTFFQPTEDPLGRGYHVRQSIIAIGSGGIFGKGLASGSQSQLRFIPASQTDFIFAVISEELGFLGALVILVLYTTIFFRLFSIAKRVNNEFAMYLVLAISFLFFSQFIINVGMNLGLMPVTGIGLPFLSYGGSFLLVSYIAIGLVESIFIRSVKYKV